MPANVQKKHIEADKNKKYERFLFGQVTATGQNNVQILSIIMIICLWQRNRQTDHLFNKKTVKLIGEFIWNYCAFLTVTVKKNWKQRWLLLQVLLFQKKLPSCKDRVCKSISISKLHLCEGGSFPTVIFYSDIQQSFFLLFMFYICLSVCRFVLKAIYGVKVCTLFCLVDIKKCSFSTSCVFWFLSQRSSLGVITDVTVQYKH